MKRARIPSGAWWSNVDSTFATLAEFLGRAKKADIEETGHDCGSRFEVTVRLCGHGGIEGAPASEHRDADWWGEPHTVVVRAHSMRDALLLAAATPLDVWFEADWQEDE